MSKKSTSSWGGRRKLPKVFTEQGIYMLMAVLNGQPFKADLAYNEIYRQGLTIISV